MSGNVQNMTRVVTPTLAATRVSHLLPKCGCDARREQRASREAVTLDVSASQQDFRCARQRNRQRRQALPDQEAQLILGERVRLHQRIMCIRRPLADLPRVGSQQLVVETTADEEEAAARASFLDDVRNWRLDIDLGENLDIV